MNLKRNICAIGVLALFATSFVNCSDWTEAEARPMTKYPNTEPARSPEYYQALREYKATEHSVSFGWYSGWGEPSSSTTGMLAGLPDSMDLISLWSSAFNLSPAKREDLRYVQQVKGTKVLVCTFLQWIGKGFTPPKYDVDEKTRETFWGWVDGDEVAIKGSMERYATAIVDSLNKYGYDGLDVDFEPNIDGVSGKLDENPTYVEWFFDILSKHMGTTSNSGLMLTLDGEIYRFPPRLINIFDYIISQAYSVSGGTPSPTAGTGESNMDGRLEQIVTRYAEFMTAEQITNKFIVTENLESAIDALNGGFFWTLRNSERQPKDVCPSLLGMARWEPYTGFRKGGFGGYRFDAEAVNKPAYKWMRRGIQAQNPAVN